MVGSCSQRLLRLAFCVFPISLLGCLQGSVPFDPELADYVFEDITVTRITLENGAVLTGELKIANRSDVSVCVPKDLVENQSSRHLHIQLKTNGNVDELMHIGISREVDGEFLLGPGNFASLDFKYDDLPFGWPLKLRRSEIRIAIDASYCDSSGKPISRLALTSPWQPLETN